MSFNLLFVFSKLCQLCYVQLMKCLKVNVSMQFSFVSFCHLVWKNLTLLSFWNKKRTLPKQNWTPRILQNHYYTKITAIAQQSTFFWPYACCYSVDIVNNRNKKNIDIDIRHFVLRLYYRGFSPEPPFQGSGMSRPSAKSIYSK